MKRRSIPSFVLGLISGIILLIISCVATYLLMIPDAINMAAGRITYYSLLGYSSMVGTVIVIVGAALCFKRARTGGVLMLVGMAFFLVLPIYSIVSMPAFSLWSYFYITPLVLLIIAMIFAFSAKVRGHQISYASTVDNLHTKSKFCEHCGSALVDSKCENCGSKQE